MHTFRSHRARLLRRVAAATTVGAALGLFVLNMTPRATGPARARNGVTHTVSIEGTGFQPQALTVKAGDAIVWVNKDPFPHTATSQAGGFDSHAIAPDKSWRYVAATKGDFAYVCLFHPTMHATLRVE